MTTLVKYVTWSCKDQLTAWQFFTDLDAAFEAVGISKTADTGQVVLGDTYNLLPYPATIVSNMYYTLGTRIRVIHRDGFPDLFLQFVYRIRNWASNPYPTPNILWYPELDFSVGTGTDGAGNLTGVTVSGNFGSEEQYNAANRAPSEIYVSDYSQWPIPIYISTDGNNYLGLVVDPNHTVVAPISQGAANWLGQFTQWAWYAERIVDVTTAAYNDEGWTFVGLTSKGHSNQNTGYASYFAVINTVRGQAWRDNYIPAQNSTGFFDSSYLDGTMAIYPISVRIPQVRGAMRGLVEYQWQDIPGGGVTFPATIYGVNQTWLTIGAEWHGNTPSLHCYLDAAGYTFNGIAMRWD